MQNIAAKLKLSNEEVHTLTIENSSLNTKFGNRNR